MTAPLVDTQDEQLRKDLKRFISHVRGYIPGTSKGYTDDEAVDWLVSVIKHREDAVAKKAEEKGYVIGFNACVDDCPDKMSTEPYGAEEVK